MKETEKMIEKVILVNEHDEALGEMEKLAVHEQGLLHRAFSVFIFNPKGELLLQRRARTKYHSPGLWTNTCCSHPRPGEETLSAAKRRLEEEMGLRCPVRKQFSFSYRAEFENGLIEHELDHVFFGASSDEPTLNLSEADAYRYVTLEDLKEEIAADEAAFTPWLRICLNEVLQRFSSHPLKA